MDEIEKVNLLANTQSVHLLREIAKWRRANGVDYWRARGILGRFTQWSEIGRDGKQVSIDFERGDEGWCAAMTIGRKRELGGLKIDDNWTLVQAVDVIVAVGYLPPRFSSAYRAGWEARHHAQTVACRNSMSEPGWNSPEVLVLTPAVEMAW